MIGCSSGQKKYEEFMESAIQEMENGDLEKVNEYLKQAREEKPEDETAIFYHEQVADLIATTEEIAAGKLSAATKKIDKIINNEDSLAILVKLAENLAVEIKKLEDAYETYHAELDQAQQHLTDKEIEKAKQSIEEIEQEN